MTLLYDLAVKFYYLAARLMSLSNPKAKKWVEGRKGLLEKLRQEVEKGYPYIWFHAASLGEFEQGRPIIEALKREKPDHKILLTFFSPSGYEIRKNYPEADLICYLPLDTKRNARRFLEIVNPVLAVFIKYEYWYHFLTGLKKHSCKVILISAVFRSGQIFFKPWGGWYRKLLRCFDHIFVQDEKSVQLLASHTIHNVTVTGDTRFDRVAQIVAETKEIPIAQEFSRDKFTFIFGSTWEKDEDILTHYINSDKSGSRFIIAPHEIHESHIKNLASKLLVPYILYSEAGKSDLSSTTVLIINNIGMLSSLYRYAQIAYIGGGFGTGIHNILEAAVYGMPVVFGPHYSKFREAHELINAGGAFPIKSYEDLKLRFEELQDNADLLASTSNATKNYVKKNLGATQIILDNLSQYLGK